jgi:hypothetical protein
MKDNMNEKIHKTPSGNIQYWVNMIDKDAVTLVFLPGLTADHRLFDKQIAYFDGIEIEYSAIIQFIEKLYALSLERENEKSQLIQKGLLALSKGAPTNTYEAMLLMYIYFMISESVDCYQVRSLGNGLDCSLLPFYENDLKNGTLFPSIS